MFGRVHAVSFCLAFAFASQLSAQTNQEHERAEDLPALYVPVRPPTQKERDERASLHAYALGLVYEQEDRVQEALKAYQEAARLDPTAPAVFKAQVPLYLALERPAEALAVTRKTLELDPGDFQAWYLLARQLKEQGKMPEARDALVRGLAVPEFKEQPDLRQQMTLDLALLHEAIGEFVPAAQAFFDAARMLEHPDAFADYGNLTSEMIAQRCAEIYERAGRMFVRARRLDDALAAYRLAQKRYPAGAGRFNLCLAQVLQEQDKLPEAMRHLDAYLRFQPQGREAYDMKLALLRKLNRTNEIIPWLEQTAEADPHNLRVKLLLASELAKVGRFDTAEKILREMARENPTPDLYSCLFHAYHEDPQTGLGKALAELDEVMAGARERPPMPGRPEQAKAMIVAIRQDAVLGKGLVQTAAKLPTDAKLHADTLVLLAALADLHRQSAEAEAFFRRALKDSTPDNETLAYAGLLRVLWKASKYEEIVRLCGEGLANGQPANRVLFHSDMAKALAQQGKIEDGLAAIDRALKLAPAGSEDHLVLQSVRIRILMVARRFDRAEAECLALLKQPRLPAEILELRYLLSGIYSEARNLPKAEEQLEAVLQLDPSNATACNDLGYLWADQNKNLARAEELIRKAIELDRRRRQGPTPPGVPPPAETAADHAAYLDSLGWVLFRKGQAEAARAELERAAALPDGDDPVIWEHLGDVLHDLRQPDRARQAWERARDLYKTGQRRQSDDRARDLQRKLQMP